MAKNARVNYTAEDDILLVHIDEPVHDSLEFDQFVIDFSKDDKLVGIEIFDASSFLKNVLDIDVDKKRLEAIKSAQFSVIQQKEFAYIKVVMIIPRVKGKELTETILTPVPMAQGVVV